MKSVRFLLVASAISLMLSSCGVFSKNKQGCGTNGKNVGAEKVLDGEGPRKTPKFRA